MNKIKNFVWKDDHDAGTPPFPLRSSPGRTRRKCEKDLYQRGDQDGVGENPPCKCKNNNSCMSNFEAPILPTYLPTPPT